MQCCDTNPDTLIDSKSLVVALAGNPNSGKTTIFNALTGLRQKVANYPGVTVEKKSGRCKLPNGAESTIIDLPGTYSLISRSPDEQVAMEVLRGLRSDTPAPDVVIVVVDASNLQRNLYLVSQLVELGRPLVVALNMTDIAKRRGTEISPERLSAQIGVPVIPVVGHKRQGIQELKQAIVKARIAPLPDWLLPPSMKEELLLVGGALGILNPGQSLDRCKATAERLLIGDTAADMRDLRLREPIGLLVDHAHSRLTGLGLDPMQADIEAHYRWIDSVSSASLVPACEQLLSNGVSPPILDYTRPVALSQKMDAILVHKVWGLAIFTVIMSLLFVSIFWLAQPMMNVITAGQNWLADLVTNHMTAGPLQSLLANGIIAGVGTVIAFVPQIALLFMFIAILEDSGYLARAAFLMDKLLARVGLHGKSFIPLLSSFACAIPGIMATRTIENRRDRLATILIAPFMSCSARLPVYALLIGAFFSNYGPMAQAGIMLGCYALGIVAAVGTAWIFKRSLLKGGATTFIMELPTYKIPQFSQVARQVWLNAGSFVTKAGTIILAFSVVLWALAYYPRLPATTRQSVEQTARIEAPIEIFNSRPPPWPTSERLLLPASKSQEDLSKYLLNILTPAEKLQISPKIDDAVAAAQSEYSFAGRLGHAMEPAIRPLGFDWKMGIGLVGAFAARETFVSTMGITYAVGGADDNTQNLANAMRADRYSSGQPVWTPLVAISLLVWFVLALQCMSTVAIVRRETGSWSWPIFMIVYMNVLAYAASLLVYQIGTHILHMA